MVPTPHQPEDVPADSSVIDQFEAALVQARYDEWYARLSDAAERCTSGCIAEVLPSGKPTFSGYSKCKCECPRIWREADDFLELWTQGGEAAGRTLTVSGCGFFPN